MTRMFESFIEELSSAARTIVEKQVKKVKEKTVREKTKEKKVKRRK